MKRSVCALAMLALLFQPRGAGAAPTATAPTVQVTLDFTDGSRLIGTSALATLPFRTDALGTMAIPFVKVRALKFNPNHESLVVSFANGDKLQGSLGTVALEVQTLLGAVTVPWEHVLAIEVRPSPGPGVEWEILPFPKDSDWPGPQGKPATLDAGEIVIQGQPVWTKPAYSAPLAFEGEFMVDQPLTHLENAAITFVPESADPSLGPPAGSLDILLQFEGASGADGGHLYLQRRGREVVSLTKKPFALQAGKSYRLKVEILADAVRVTLNGQVYEAPGITLPFKAFHIRLSGWMPDKVWHVRNSVVH